MTAVNPTTPALASGSNALVASWEIAKRAIKKFIRTPALIVVATIQGAMFLLIFRYVFGGAIGVGGMRYVDFLVPGYVTTGILFSGMNAAAGVAEDMEKGFVDRLRSMPFHRGAVLGGRALADTGLLIWSTFVTSGIGFLVGFRLHAGVGKGLLAFALLILFGFAFEWVFVLMGLLAGSAQAAQGLALLIFPFTFVSSAFVPVDTMPGWMQPVARNQPLTVMTNAVRTLTQGGKAEAFVGDTASYWITRSLLWTVGITLVFAVIAIARFRKS
jgi:ABC-2 type transport system permease protein